jgi:hypothetical protein
MVVGGLIVLTISFRGMATSVPNKDEGYDGDPEA